MVAAGAEPAPETWTPWGGLSAIESGEALMVLIGDIDMAATDSLTPIARQVLGLSPERVVLDCSAVTFMDSSGLRLLCMLESHLAPAPVVVRSPSEPVLKLLQISSLSERFAAREPA